MRNDSTLQSDILHVMVDGDSHRYDADKIAGILHGGGRYDSIPFQIFCEKVVGHLYFLKDQELVDTLDIVVNGIHSHDFRLTLKGERKVTVDRSVKVSTARV